MPRTASYLARCTNYGEDARFVADRLERDHRRADLPPTVYWPGGRIDVLWLDLGVKSYYDRLQGLPGRVRASVANPFDHVAGPSPGLPGRAAAGDRGDDARDLLVAVGQEHEDEARPEDERGRDRLRPVARCLGAMDEAGDVEPARGRVFMGEVRRHLAERTCHHPRS